MARHRTLRDLRQEHEAAVARGLVPEDDGRPSRSRGVSLPKERETRASTPARMRVVWAVCDMGGRTVATFDYTDKADAEAKVAELKARGKGPHFVRSEKVPMGG